MKGNEHSKNSLEESLNLNELWIRTLYYFIISEPNKTKTRVTYNGSDRVSKRTPIFVLWWVKWKIIKRMWLLIIIFSVIKHLCQSQWKRKKKILNKWVFIINVYFCMCSKVRLWHLEKYDRCQDQVLSDICPVKNRSTASSHWAQGNKPRQESSQASLSNGNKTSLPATLNLISRHVHTQGL